MDVIIIGSGAVAAEICSYLEDINKENAVQINVRGFIDDNQENFKANAERYKFDQQYLGTSDNYQFSQEDLYIFGFANLQGRAAFLNKIKDKALNFLTIIHPTAQIARTARIGVGNVINPYCVIGPNALIGDHNLLTSYSFISHDCIVGDNNFFSTAGLSGNAIVGDNNFFGIRVTVLPSVSIGSNNIIQAGMTIDKTVTDNETVFYRYKEKVTIINKA